MRREKQRAVTTPRRGLEVETRNSPDGTPILGMVMLRLDRPQTTEKCAPRDSASPATPIFRRRPTWYCQMLTGEGVVIARTGKAWIPNLKTDLTAPDSEPRAPHARDFGFKDFSTKGPLKTEAASASRYSFRTGYLPRQGAHSLVLCSVIKLAPTKGEEVA